MRYAITNLVILIALAMPRPGAGQVTSLANQRPAEPPKATKIVLHPMAETRPALKYPLLPPILDQHPGNAAVCWNRIPAERWVFFGELHKENGPYEKIEQWMKIPLGDPREREFRAKEPLIAITANRLYKDMARAARFESCDWQLPYREGNVIEMLIPEAQQMRIYGRLLAAKARLELADGKFTEAAETLQTGFAAARHAGCGRTLIHGLVGITIAQQMTNRIEEAIQQPAMPNLYWSLAVLPRPMVDIGPALEMEEQWLFLQFPDLRDLDKKDLALDQWRKLLIETIREWRRLNRLIGSNALEVPPELQATAMAIAGYPLAKRYLIARGRGASEVEAMPVAKVVLLHSMAVFQDLADDYFKTSRIPLSEGGPWFLRADRELYRATRDMRETIPFATTFLPAVNNARQAETRMEWILARLRVLEALRIYAAGHEGKLPDRLEDITEVPIPKNPFDDKPFDYHRNGATAVLDSAHAPPGVPSRYEIIMLPKGEKP